MRDEFSTWTAADKAGQSIMFGFDGTEVNEHAIRMIRDYKIGNVILFSRNIDTPSQLSALVAELHELGRKHLRAPLFVAIDQEGGMVTRILRGATFFPGAMTIAASGDPANAEIVGRHMGEELRAFGINMNLAPVLDVNNNPRNPVIGVRSFGDDPASVAEYGGRFIDGLQANVVATAKHFPGHGDTHVDSHLDNPVVDVDLKRLHAIELAPFKAAIERGVAAVMTAHVEYPVLDGDTPATLSSKILNGLLRDELAFEGVIITDCMQMQAIQKRYKTPEASRMALSAGADIVCVCHSETLQTQTQARLLEAVRSGEFDEDHVDARLRRIVGLKRRYAVERLEDIATIRALVENPKTRALSQAVVDAGVSLVRGKRLKLREDALLVWMLPKTTSIADETADDHLHVLKAAMPWLDTMALPSEPSLQAIEDARTAAEGRKQVVIGSYNAGLYENQQKLIRALHTTSAECHVLAMRNPYDLFSIPDIENYVCFYEMTAHSVDALIRYLKGSLTPTGVCPVDHG